MAVGGGELDDGRGYERDPGFGSEYEEGGES